jgi:hypothetical protein
MDFSLSDLVCIPPASRALFGLKRAKCHKTRSDVMAGPGTHSQRNLGNDFFLDLLLKAAKWRNRP